ncbi:MAG: sugar ABC transporter substrate-binding protein [Saccharofermentanales bacterium]
MLSLSNKEEKAEEPAKETEAAPDVSGEGFEIGFAQAQADSPYYVTLQDSAQAACEAAGVDFRLIDAAKDPSKQSQDVADLIQSGVSLVILNPVDSDSCAPAIQSSLDSGVPLITVNRPSNAEGAVSHVGEDNKHMGNTVGLAALELLGGSGNVEGKKIIEFMGGAGNNNTNLRSAGFHEAFEGEGVEIIQSPYCDFNRAKAVEAAQDLFQAHPDVALVFGHNDDMSIGAMQVAEQQGLEGIYFTGVDGLMEAVEYIVEGKYHVTTMNDPKLQGQESVNVALKILAGEEVESFVDVGTQLITADNAAEYVSDEDFATQVK